MKPILCSKICYLQAWGIYSDKLNALTDQIPLPFFTLLLSMNRITRTLLSLFFLATCLTSYAQGNYDVILSFDGCTIEDASTNSVEVVTLGDPTCACAPVGDAYVFDGTLDAITMQDTNIQFRQAFSVGINFRPDSDLDQQRLVSYKASCNSPQGFDLTYNGSSNSVAVDLYEAIGRSVSFQVDLSDDRCWHSATFIKSGSGYQFYLYGELVFTTTSPQSYDVGSAGRVTLAGGPCVPTFANAFRGAISYFAVYDDVMPLADIRAQNYPANEITTADGLIFVGESLDVEVNAPCASTYFWSPAAGVSDFAIANPTLSPTETTIYSVDITEGGCTVTDSIRLLVVDPTQVTCNELILPTAFTPNGDNLNDTYFISNGFVIERLIRFEIFDRVGGKLFSTDDVTMGWDGRYQGEYVMPGVYVYKAEYVCNNETQTQVGSFSVLN